MPGAQERTACQTAPRADLPIGQRLRTRTRTRTRGGTARCQVKQDIDSRAGQRSAHPGQTGEPSDNRTSEYGVLKPQRDLDRLMVHDFAPCR